LFSVFVVAGGLKLMDRFFVFNIYIICFLTATSLYFWPLIQIRENIFIVSIFKKFKNAPIDKRLFVRSKLVMLMRFSILFYIPVQIMHFIGLNRTKTPQLSVTGFWPLIAMILTFIFQYGYMKFRARDLYDD